MCPHRYWMYPISEMDNFVAKPGNYIFAKHSVDSAFPIYIGQTGDLSERFDGHHKMPCIKRNGATHIHVHTSSSDEDVRKREESDLIRKWNPPCNG